MSATVDDVLASDVLPIIYDKSSNTVPFPQANSVDCILRLLLNTEIDGSKLSSYIATNVVNSARQAQYYISAAIYLGLCRKIGRLYCPTANGMRIQNAPESSRKHMLAAYILSHPVIGRWFTRIFLLKTTKDRLSFIETGFKMKLSKTTIRRRSQCVLAWMEWAQKNLPCL